MKRVGLPGLFFVLLSAGSAAAQDCRPLTLAAGMDLFYDPAGRPLVQATLNGRDKHLLVDTGAVRSALHRTQFSELDIPIRQSGRTMRHSATGFFSNEYGLIGEFRLAGLRSPDHPFFVLPLIDTIGDGLIGSEVLQRYDVDLDFSAGRLQLFHPDDCSTRAIPSQLKPLAVVPFSFETGDISFPVALDGRQVTAILDTGAGDTYMNIEFAKRRFAVDLGAPDVERRGEIEGVRRADVFRRRFKTLSIGGITVADPMITLWPDMGPPRRPAVLDSAESRLSFPPLVVGMSILSSLHVTIAYRERKIYFYEAGAAPAAGETLPERIQLCRNDDVAAERRILACALAALSGRVVKPEVLIGLRASAYHDKGDYAQATAAWDAALRLDPGRAAFYAGRAGSSLMRRDNGRAIADYTQALMLDGAAAQYYHLRGLAYAEEGEAAAAIADFDAAIARDPDYAEAYLRRGIAWREVAPERALADLEKAARLDPAYADRIAIGDFFAAGRTAEVLRRIAAASDYYELLSLRIDRRYQSLWKDLRVRDHLQVKSFASRHLAGARASFQKAPEDAAALAALLHALNLSGRFAEAIEMSQRMPAQFARRPESGDQAWVVNELANALVNEGRVEEANAAFARLLEMPLHEKRFLVNQVLNYGVSLFYQGRFDDAVRVLAPAEDLVSEYGASVIRAVRVCVLAQQGKSAEADLVLRSFEDRPQQHRNTLEALICLKRTDDAAALMIRMLQSPHRSVLLMDLQNCTRNPRRQALARSFEASFRALRDRPDVRSATEAVGVILETPANC